MSLEVYYRRLVREGKQGSPSLSEARNDFCDVARKLAVLPGSLPFEIGRRGS